MIYRFMLVSDESDDFVREIKIDAGDTFLDFHKAILSSVGYENDSMASFFVCDEDWNKEIEVTEIPMDTSSEEDSYVMETTHLEDLVEEEGQRLMYIFDYLTDRAFFIELREIILNQSLSEPSCIRSNGTPPAQTLDFDTIAANAVGHNQTESTLDEDFYGDVGYNEDELDRDGFEGLDNLGDDYFEESRY